MILRNIKIKNFQKHSHLELDFTPGVNVLYGATDAGKSCVRRAITWVFFNTPSGDVIRKENTKKTSVTIALDNGIIVERIKSQSINAYILQIGKEKKRFDAIGRSVPEEIAKVLKTSLIEINGETINLNIADQIAFPFLMDKSGTFRSKLFNKLTGSEITDKVLQDLNKDILRILREEKTIQEDLVQKENQQKDMKNEINKLEKKYNEASEQYKDLETKKGRFIKMNDTFNKLNNNKERTKLLEQKIIKYQKPLPDIDELKIKTQRLKDLNNLKNLNDLNKTNTKNLQFRFKNLKKLPETTIEMLKNIWSKLDMFKNLNNKISIRKTKELELKKKKEKTSIVLEKWIERYKNELKTRGICPTCKQTITDETVEKIKA